MPKSLQKKFLPVVFDRLFFDPHFGRYTFRLVSPDKDEKITLSLPVQVFPEEMAAVPFLLTDPLIRNLLKTLRIKVEQLTLFQHDGVWRGKVTLKWGLWRKQTDVRPFDVVRFSIEFHKPIMVPSEMVRPVVVQKSDLEKKQAYKALFMSRSMRRGELFHEEIM